VTAEVGSDDVVAVGQVAGELAETPAVRRDAVETGHLGEARVAPLVDVEPQSVSSPLLEGR
jgi:hypothetical protein